MQGRAWRLSEGLRSGRFDPVSYTHLYRRIACEAGKFLCAEGRIYLEIGYDQARAVAALLEENSFYEVRVFKAVSYTHL